MTNTAEIRIAFIRPCLLRAYFCKPAHALHEPINRFGSNIRQLRKKSGNVSELLSVDAGNGV